VEAVRVEIEKISRDFPQIQFIPLMDTSAYIKQSINNVRDNAIIGGVLAVVILFLFLRNVSSTVIIATAIPISIISEPPFKERFNYFRSIFWRWVTAGDVGY
jgi:HAE1 family hydrophobic/amphiphilic exporter-1